MQDFGRYWLGLKKPLIDPATHARYEDALDNHAFKFLGRIDLRELRPMQIQEWINGELRHGYQVAKALKAADTVVFGFADGMQIPLRRRYTDVVKAIFIAFEHGDPMEVYGRRKNVGAPTQAQSLDQYTTTEVKHLVDPAPRPDEALAERQVERALERAVAGLEPTYRSALVARRGGTDRSRGRGRPWAEHIGGQEPLAPGAPDPA